RAARSTRRLPGDVHVDRDPAGHRLSSLHRLSGGPSAVLSAAHGRWLSAAGPSFVDRPLRAPAGRLRSSRSNPRAIRDTVAPLCRDDVGTPFRLAIWRCGLSEDEAALLLDHLAARPIALGLYDLPAPSLGRRLCRRDCARGLRQYGRRLVAASLAAGSGARRG